MEYRYANNQLEQLPVLAAELVKIPVAVIVTSGGPGPTLAAKAATTTIPIVFGPLPDPVRSGVVASFNRPGGNITGVAALTIELDPKRLELLDELTPASGPFGVLPYAPRVCLAGRPGKREYPCQFGSHLGNPGGINAAT
jgi:putative tryptophan/tyrosine transport system substrate-binding protein